MSERKIVSVLDVTDLSKEHVRELVRGDIRDFNSLTKGDLLSVFKFFCACATNPKADVFVTESPLLLANRDKIEKNTGIRIMTMDEVSKAL